MEYFIGVFLVIGLPIWIMFSIPVAVAADARGRSGMGWFMLSLLLSPFFTLVLLIAHPVLPRETYLTQKAKEDQPATKDCPDCAQTIKAAAKVCPFCGFRPPGAMRPEETKPALVAERVSPLMAALDCRSCGALMAAADKRCKRCGTSVDPLAAP